MFAEFLDWFWKGLSTYQRYFLSDSALKDFAAVLVVLSVTIVLEVAGRRNWRIRYGSRNFRIDILYYIFYYGGVYHIIVFAWIYKSLTGLISAYAPWLQLNLLSGAGIVIQSIVATIVFDFVGYWSHRMRHASAGLWAFHTIHHSQKVLTVMTNYRFHFVDETVLRLCVFVPFQLLGTDFEVWLMLDFILIWILLLQHSEWDWTYGWFGRILVSPSFHRKHHSMEEHHQNCNFSMLFSFWDDWFGTADRTSAPPTAYGLEDDPVPDTIFGQIVMPFILCARSFGLFVRRPVK